MADRSQLSSTGRRPHLEFILTIKYGKKSTVLDGSADNHYRLVRNYYKKASQLFCGH